MSRRASSFTFALLTLLVAACEVTTDSFALAQPSSGSTTLAPGETPNWSEHVAPLLSFGCGGCHSDVAKSGNCVGLTCFVDDPCELAELGCCTLEEPFLTCANAAKKTPKEGAQRFTRAECGVMRMELALTMAKDGSLEAMQGDAKEGSAEDSARSAAMGFMNFEGFDAVSEKDIALLRVWLATGTDLPDQCEMPAAAQ